MRAATSLYFDTRKQKNNGTYPVKIRVTYQRKQKYYPTGIDLSPQEWEKLNSKKLTKEYKQIKEKLNYYQGKAISIVEDLKVFSFEIFENRLHRKKVSEGLLIDLYNDTIERLRSEDRISTAVSCQYSLNSLIAFKTKIGFSDLSVDFLNKYEKWMLEKGKSSTTIGIYLRSLRSICNEAIEKGDLPRELYPFGRRKYVIPSGKGVKKALNLADVEKIMHYPTPHKSTMQKALDFWLFSYLTNGINTKDIARLKNKDISDKTLVFTRAKTQHTTKGTSKKIVVHLLPQTKTIIKRWRNPDNSPNAYLFSILSTGMTAQEEYATIQQFVKITNKYMRQIANDLKIEKDVTTYTARHTFSTVLKRSGASVEYIQEALGHKDKSTTESYLDSFEEDTKKKFAQKLVQFRK